MEQEKEFMAYTQIGTQKYEAYHKTSPQIAYQNLLTLLKNKRARISTRTWFCVREIDYDPSHTTIIFSIFGDWHIQGKKPEIENLLSMAS